MSNTKSTQLTYPKDFKAKNIIFKPNAQMGGGVKYHRVNLEYKNADGSTGLLVVPTPEVFSFGVSENKKREEDQPKGDDQKVKPKEYTLPLCLWSRDPSTKKASPNEQEKAWTDTFDKIVDACKKWMLANREAVEKYDLEEGELKKISPMYWKKDKGKIIVDDGPTLYAKLISNKKNGGSISTIFTDMDGNSIDPLTLVGCYGNVVAAIQFESIYVGKDIKLQCRVYDAMFRALETGRKQLLPRQITSTKMKVGGTNALLDDDEEGGGDDTGSVKADDDDEPKRIEPPAPRPAEAVASAPKKFPPRKKTTVQVE